MMLKHPGEQGAGKILMNAIQRATESEDCLPANLGIQATIREDTGAVIGVLEAHNI